MPAEDKRKSFRSKCLIPADVIKAGGKDDLVERTTVHDFSREGLRLCINFNLKPGTLIDLKLFVPEKKITTSLLGKVTWTKCMEDKFVVGVKIVQMDEKAKEDIQNWVFPGWLEYKTKKKKKNDKKRHSP